MAKIIWSPSSINDLKIIYEYISNDSIKYANQFINKLIDNTEHLRIFPKSGKIVEELNEDDIREIICKPYRIIYKIVNQTDIRILSIIHGARNWKPDNL